jgi:hypothetical protein
MRLSLHSNPFDLAQVEIIEVCQATIGVWLDGFAMRHAVCLVLVDGEVLPCEQYGDQVPAGADVRVMLKPGDPSFWVMVALTGISVVSSLLMPRPKLPSDAELSPTYSLGAQSNQARLGMPVPVQYGRNRIWPDLLTQPFSTYNNNDQYLYQLFCLGLGEFDVEALKIEDTDVSAFEEIEYQYYYNQPVTLFPTDVVSSAEPASQELGFDPIGPFVASGPNTEANRLEIDIVWESGLFYARSSGDTDPASTTIFVEYWQVDDAGSAIGPITNHTISVTDTTRSPKRMTYGASVAPGRYAVQVRRTDPQFNGPKVFSRCVWEGLRAYLETDAKTYPDTTVLAVRARATGNLSDNSSRRFNMIATRKLPVIDDEGNWTEPTATRSIAAALADIVRAHYGAARADVLLDVDRLLQLHEVWQSRRDRFDYRFDTTVTLWEALKIASRAGRAFPIMNNQVISFVRTAPQTLPATIFNRNNTRNFRVEYSLIADEDYDSIIAEYIDPDSGWKPNQVLCQPPGSAAANPERVTYKGIVDRTQAFREGIYEAQAKRVQRKQCRFETELEGYIPNRGDLIIVANEDFQFTQGGDIVAVSGTSLFTSEPLEWGGSRAIRLRRQDGTADEPRLVTQGVAENEAVLNAPLDWEPYTAGAAERTKYQFGAVGSTLVEWIVREISPRGGNVVEVVGVNEVDSVHFVDQADPPDSIIPGPIASLADGPIVRTLLVEYTSNPAFLHIAWSAAPGAEYYVLERRFLIDGVYTEWVRWATTADTQLQLATPAGEIQIRVAGVGKAKGPWVTWSGTVGRYVIHSPTDLDLRSELILGSDGSYHSQITFTFTPPEDDYHIRSFEAEYQFRSHGVWRPLFNALENTHVFESADLGTILVRVRSVYIQNEVFSDWAETSIINLGTYDQIAEIGLTEPVDPKLFVTLDRENQRAQIRVEVSYDRGAGEDQSAQPEQFLLFYSLDDVPNQLLIANDAGNKLYITVPNIEGAFDLAVTSGSSATFVKYSDPTDIVDVDLSGMWWIQIRSPSNGNTRFYKVTEVDTSTFYINQADPFPFTPEAGDTIAVIEVSYHDSRLPEFSFGYANGEVVRHNGVSHDGADSDRSKYFIDVAERAVEGSTQANLSGSVFHYYPAWGADTNTIPIKLEEFTVREGGRLVYTGDVPVNIPATFNWLSLTCCFVRRATVGDNVAWIRSHIVPLTHEGNA